MKKSKFLLITVICAVAAVFFSVSAFAASSTGIKTVTTYYAKEQSIEFDIYITDGTAIAGYCNFKYDNTALNLLDSSGNAVKSPVPEFSEDGSSTYLKSVVVPFSNASITDVSKGAPNLINTNDGIISFAWTIPSNFEPANAENEDVPIARLLFSVTPGIPVHQDSIKIAAFDLTSYIPNWMGGVVIIDSEKKSYAFDNKSEYTREFATIGSVVKPVPDDSSESGSDITDEEKTDSSDNSEIPETEHGGDDQNKQDSENAPPAADDTGKEDNNELKDDNTSEENDQTDNGKFPDGIADPDDKENDGESSSNCPYVKPEETESVSSAEKKNFSLTAEIETEKVRIKWINPEDFSESASYDIYVYDSDFEIVMLEEGISCISNSLLIEGLYGNTFYYIYIIAKDNTNEYISEVLSVTTADYEGFPPVTVFDVTYDKKGCYLYGLASEKVLYGKAPVKAPDVITNEGLFFLGWSKDGKTVVDLQDEKIYSDTVYTPIISTQIPKSYPSYITGYADGTFKPLGNITRAEAATLISRISPKYDKNARYCHTFTDCPSGIWYEKAVAFCSSYGYIKGYNDGKFNPDGFITRAEFATILVRVFGFEDVMGYNVFSDLDNHWSKDSISVLYSAGIIKPDENRNFRPDEKLTRQDAVSMLNKCLNILPDKLAIDTYTKQNGYKFTDVPHYSDYYYDIMAAVINY